ncbi:hypothetical protein RvY_06721 [Ramazzottius varieornatus]|uniref:XK-related protein n=1 Tax=Ramazzottius varieornatus TaxID=947166 RepID=A0A1D1V939_RAMVA|nr:hypothetical protein RvY_06721 [Ramazzottius varieornatus]
MAGLLADPYHSRGIGLVVSVYGMLVMLGDMTTDVWIASSHFGGGHDSWSYLAIAFFFIPIIFALGYTVILRGYERWFQVERCQKRYRYSSADECYVEAFPECILQGYFIARLLSRVDVHPEEYCQEVSWSMWISLLVSAISLVSFESSVAYNRQYANTLFEPSKLDILVRIILDFMTLLPRLASIACFCTVTPRVVAVCSFIVLHTIVVFIWLVLSSTHRQPIPREAILLEEEQEEDLDTAFEDFRGYKKHRANAINHLRATIVSFLFPPTCSWHMLEAQRISASRNVVHPRSNRSTMQLVRRGSPKQFWMWSIFQFLESGALFGVWLYYTWMHTHELNQILLPTLSLTCLALRPFCDVVCQMKLLTPLAQDEVQNCVRFKGVLAKTRILQVGTDLVNSIAADLLPKLSKASTLLHEEPDEKKTTEIKIELDSIAEEF